jgi:simple sugar transport system ATP-binding protein
VVEAVGLEVAPLEGRGPGVRKATFELRAGEIVGIAAIEGNGQRELLLAVAGLLHPLRGRLSVGGPVALIPADRTTEGLIPALTITENVVLGFGSTAPWLRGPWLDWSSARRHTALLLPLHDVRAPGPDVAAATLSGGNQQKLILGRALAQRPAVVVAENPTRGLDIRATVTVHSRLQDAARNGVAVLLHSSDLDEVLALADRVLVVADGLVRAMPPGSSRQAVGSAMLGLSSEPDAA